MARQTLSQVLLRDLVNPSGLTPMLGEAQRAEMLLEHLAIERRAVGAQLQNMETLMACIAAYFEEYTDGKRSKDALISELSRTVTVLAREMFYDENAALEAK